VQSARLRSRAAVPLSTSIKQVEPCVACELAESIAALDQFNREELVLAFLYLGSYYLSSCLKSVLCVFVTPLNLFSSLLADTYATCVPISNLRFAGRWVTNFRAGWDPKNNSSFVIGNMQRFADVFDAETGIQEIDRAAFAV
jgi:hypothetical protein